MSLKQSRKIWIAFFCIFDFFIFQIIMNSLYKNIENYLFYLSEVEGENIIIGNDYSINEQDISENKDTNNHWSNSTSLEELNSKIKNCQKCPLGKLRKNFVFGSGNPNAEIMIIGEAPGADEDEQGEPFVGKAGKLLTKILAAINLSRDEVYIANILKCRPPNNRKPLPSEEEQCEPYLKKQIELIKPRFILALGLTAADRLLKSKNTMGEIRGKLFKYENIDLIVTYHPSALLRNPSWKRDTWEDVKLLRKLYDEYLKSLGEQ